MVTGEGGGAEGKDTNETKIAIILNIREEFDIWAKIKNEKTVEADNRKLNTQFCGSSNEQSHLLKIKIALANPTRKYGDHVVTETKTGIN